MAFIVSLETRSEGHESNLEFKSIENLKAFDLYKRE